MKLVIIVMLFLSQIVTASEAVTFNSILTSNSPTKTKDLLLALKKCEKECPEKDRLVSKILAESLELSTEKADDTQLQKAISGSRKAFLLNVTNQSMPKDLMTALELYVKLSADHGPLWRSRGENRDQEFSQIDNAFHKVFEADPKNAEAYRWFATYQFFKENKDTFEQTKALAKCLTLDPAEKDCRKYYDNSIKFFSSPRCYVRDMEKPLTFVSQKGATILESSDISFVQRGEKLLTLRVTDLGAKKLQDFARTFKSSQFVPLKYGDKTLATPSLPTTISGNIIELKEGTEQTIYSQICKKEVTEKIPPELQIGN